MDEKIYADMMCKISADYERELFEALEVSPSRMACILNKEYCTAMQNVGVDTFNSEKEYVRIRNKYLEKMAEYYGLSFKEGDFNPDDVQKGMFCVIYRYDIGCQTKTKSIINMSKDLFFKFYEDITTLTGKTYNGVIFKGTKFTVIYRSRDLLFAGGIGSFKDVYVAANVSLGMLRYQYFPIWHIQDVDMQYIISDLDERYKSIREYAVIDCKRKE